MAAVTQTWGPKLTPRVELEVRRDRFLQGLAAAGLDLAMVTSPASVYYLTGIELGGYATEHALFVDATGRYRFVVRAGELSWTDHFAAATWCTDWQAYRDDEDVREVYARIAADAWHGRVGRFGAETDRRSVARDTVDTVAAALGTSVEPVTSIVESLRTVKSGYEIETMRQAGLATAAGTLAAFAAIREGGTDTEAVVAASAAMAAAGSDFLCDTPFVAFGPESGQAHARSVGRRPDPGGVASTMMSASLGRHQCPIERTVAVGEPSRETAHWLDVCTSATEHVLAGLRPGMTSRQADSLAEEYFAAAGAARLRPARLAYSVGIAFPPLWWENELMQLRPGDDREVVAGMTFHLVPCLNVPGVGFLNQSMPVVITETGCEPLTDLPLRLPPT